MFCAFDEVFADTLPDLVVSGINPGNNLGQAVNHSGTVKAPRSSATPTTSNSNGLPPR